MNDGSAVSLRAITPSDVTTFDPTRGIYVGGSGDLALVMFDGTTGTLTNVPVGTHPYSVKQVKATGTTATGIYGLY